MASVLTAGMLAGCNSDYLELAPVTAVSTADVQQTEEGAQQALYGLCHSMYMMYTGSEDMIGIYLFPIGEPYIMTLYGDVIAEDYFSYLWNYLRGDNTRWSPNNMPTAYIPSIPWTYYYNLINQANVILGGVDTIEGDKAKLQLIKAQALTFRAHSYTRLLQLYAPRWEDSQNGERYCIVIRTEAGTDEVPLSKMKDVVTLIYNDLEEAEKIYAECGIDRTAGWQPNLNVAQAIHARIAMLIHDYDTAYKMAGAARKNYQIMSADEYKSGFCTPNKEWIWYGYNNGETGYATWAMLYGCNGVYVTDNEFGAGAINYDLYRKFPKGDIRSDLFFTPDKLVGNRVGKNTFWNEQWIDKNTMNLNAKNSLMKAQVKAFNDKTRPTDDGIDWIAPYQGSEYFFVVFGAQYKFWGKDRFGAGCYCFIRGAEMLLTEAEAALLKPQSQPEVTIANLKELNAQRNPNYECNLSGDALYEELKTQRRLELWGEGFNFFDLKRWNMPLNKRPWVQRDPESNNIPVEYQLHKEANDRGWVMAVPDAESRYNKLIDRSLLDN